jgi:histidyl-tRNA synthetase
LENKITQITTIIDKKDKIPPEEFTKLLHQEQLTPEQIDQIFTFISSDLENISQLSQEPEFLAGIEELKEVLDYLEKLNIQEYKVDFGIVRGLDYYTGTVFETFIEEERSL